MIDTHENICIALASHCIGLDRKKPYKRHGRYFYSLYRDYYIEVVNK